MMATKEVLPSVCYVFHSGIIVSKLNAPTIFLYVLC
jgi:hypothetical protein